MKFLSCALFRAPAVLALAALAGACTETTKVQDSRTNTFVPDSGSTSCDSVSNAWKVQDLGTSATTGTSGETTLFGIWGSGTDSIFTVGQKGKVLFYDGKTWKSQTSPTTEDLWSVWGTSATDVWAAGLGGTVIHYDGKSWTADNPDVSLFWTADGGLPKGDAAVAARPNLFGIWAVKNGSGSDVWSVGLRGTVLKKTAAKWTKVTSGVEEDLYGVWGSSTSQVFIVGNYGVILVGGTSLSKQSTGSSKPLRGVWGRSGSDVYAVGLTGTILHYYGGKWSSIDGAPKQVLRGIWGPASDSSVTYIVGWDGTLLRMSGGPSYTKGATFDSYNCITSKRLEGVWGTTRTSVTPYDAGVASVATWICGASGTVLSGP